MSFVRRAWSILPVSAALVATLGNAAPPPPAVDPGYYTARVRPVLMEHCSGCHNPNNPKNKAGFLKAASAADVAAGRGLWRKVALHLQNRTMPPVANKLSEEDRIQVARWVDDQLRVTACDAGEQPGSVTVRRLSRREYRNTIRDLLGIDFPVEDLFPGDGSGGEGFDNNGETLFIPPILMERYLEAAQQILDRVIITPGLNRNFGARELFPGRVVNKDRPLVLQPGEQVSTTFQVLADGDYQLAVWIDRPRDREKHILIQVDEQAEKKLVYIKDSAGGPTARSFVFSLARGPHKVSIRMGDAPIDFFSIRLDQRVAEPAGEKRVLHYRLLGLEPGQSPADQQSTARRVLERFLPRAFRRPVDRAEVDKLLTLFERGAKRGDPFEESIKLALKGALLSPDFLFRLEREPDTKQPRLLNGFELASRLSYFLWSTMPDDELFALAAAGKLTDERVLGAQADRMIDDPRSRAFASNFIDQWLGTKDVGGRVAPTVSAVQHFYTPEVAVDLREEPVLLFHHMLNGNRSLLELITANYTFLNERLVRFYELEGRIPPLNGTGFQRVEWPDARRAGVLGMGSVLALTSHFQETSPVLRGAWILDTILGTPAPAPPPDVPPLDEVAKKEKGLTARQKLIRHQENPSCAACHSLIDPIGFSLENFDWLGRWRDTDSGKPVEPFGVLPTGEKFSGPEELRRILVTSKKDEFLRRVAGKVMGYALGRSLEDADQCTIQRMVTRLDESNHGTRTLVREVVMSPAFRYRGPSVERDPDPPRPVIPKRTITK